MKIALQDRQQILACIRADDHELNARLRRSARRLADEFFGRQVFLRGLIEFSNNCRRDCLYCGLRASNRRLERYRLTADEIVAQARLIKANDVPTVVLQSGEDPGFRVPELCAIVRRIIAATGLVVTLSTGEFAPGEYRALRAAGASRYLLRHETANPELYARLHPGDTLGERLACLASLNTCGFEVGDGFLIGLPGQTPQDLLADLELLAHLEIEMAGIGPFIANPDTPMAALPNGSVEVSLNLIALIRHLLPGCNIPATTALDSLCETGWEQGLAAGANVVMPNLTPTRVKSQYRLYPGKRVLAQDPVECLRRARERLLAAGYVPSKAPGWSQVHGKA